MTPSPGVADLATTFARYRPELQLALRSSIPRGRWASELFAILEYHLGWRDEDLAPVEVRGGKLLRPIFCLLACEAVGGDYRRALPAAAALELLHNFSLIHDDVEDRGAERRGRKTVWAKWGEPIAVNAGDALLIISELTLLGSLEAGLRPELVLQLTRLLNECCLALTEGQHLDLTLEGNPRIGIDDYLRIIEGKTAALLGCSTQIGAIAAGAPTRLTEAFRRFGENVGRSFQIEDDVLGIWGDSRETGKPAAADVFGRKVTLPVIDALARAPKPVATRISQVYASGEPTPADVAEVVSYLDGLDARRRAEARSAEYLDHGLQELTSAGIVGKAADELRLLACSLVGRKS